VDGQRHHGHFRPARLDGRRRVDAGGIRQANVHQHQAGPQRFHQPQRLLRAAGLAHNLQIRLVFQQRAQPRAHHSVIVHQ
jgi:hypothetical protein